MRGVCELFCPEAETKLRTDERLLHFYELKDGQKHIPGVLVKSFSRSAAGIKKPHPKDMRTIGCLQKTTEYLLKDIILDKRKPYNIAYDFIFDRLRAIRQEIVIQNLNARQTIILLEPMIMFLAYSRYRLCEEPLDNFDPKICEQHLQECLKRTLCCYEEVPTEELTLAQLKRRYFIESLYQIFNLGAPEALRRCLTVRCEESRNDKVFAFTCKLALAYNEGNLYRVINGITQLPHILCAISVLKLQELRRKLLEIFAHAYNSKQLSVPIDFINRITQYADEQALFKFFKHYNVQYSDKQKSITFHKCDFNSNAKQLLMVREAFVENKLKEIYLPEVLLLKRF